MESIQADLIANKQQILLEKYYPSTWSVYKGITTKKKLIQADLPQVFHLGKHKST